MPRPSKSQRWPIRSIVSINLSHSEIIDYIKTDIKGCVRTNKRGFAGKQAYVILGGSKKVDDDIVIPSETSIWTCEIDLRGTVSSIGAENAGKEVTVIVLV